MERKPRPVTFLFTDIEGSTHLWDAHPAAMRTALARHDALLGETITRHGGSVFKTVGDAFCCRFEDSARAVAAALAAQQALAAEPWPDGLVLKVRMALARGEAEERAGDWFGAPLNRAARLLRLAHGGQVLLPAPVADEGLPPGVELRDLGRHRLRDVAVPDHIYQLCHSDLPSEFPPLESWQAPPNNLPAATSSFIGRERELAEVRRRLQETRLLTLTGVGGSGKTRLGLHVAHDLLAGPNMDDGIWLVELAPMTSGDLVPQAVATALQLAEPLGAQPLPALVRQLMRRQLLLILDNCEHLLSPVAELAEALLSGCPNLRILATSREGLSIAGEVLYTVPSLSLPAQDAVPEVALRSESMTLLADRARAVAPRFSVTLGNVVALTEICHRLDGIPLALELAAARLQALTPEGLAARLDQRFQLLTGGSRTALERHRTLHATLDWSHSLLSPQEQVAFRRLAAFAGGWTLEAAEAVVPDDCIVTPGEVLDLLTGLVHKSLVEFDAEARRYRFLETMRQYAVERLDEAGEGEMVRRRHLQWFLRVALDRQPRMGEAAVRRRLGADHANIGAAHAFAASSPADVEDGLRLAGPLVDYWKSGGHWGEARERLEALLEHPVAPRDSRHWAFAAWFVGHLAQTLLDRPAWERWTNAAALSAAASGDGQTESLCLRELGHIAFEHGDREAGLAQVRAAVRVAADGQMIAEQTWSCLVLAQLLVFAGQCNEARTVLAETRDLAGRWGHPAAVFSCHIGLGQLAVRERDWAAVRSAAEQALETARRLDNVEEVRNVTRLLLLPLAWGTGDRFAADAIVAESVHLAESSPPDPHVTDGILNTARLALDWAELGAARRLLRSALLPLLRPGVEASSLAFGLLQLVRLERGRNGTCGAHLIGAIDAWAMSTGAGPIDRMALEGHWREGREQLRTALGDAAYEAAYAAGAAVPPEQFLQLVRDRLLAEEEAVEAEAPPAPSPVP